MPVRPAMGKKKQGKEISKAQSLAKDGEKGALILYYAQPYFYNDKVVQ